jgi:ADP-ribosylglycohydrolase
LVGRKAFSLLYEARLIVNEAQKMPKEDLLKEVFPKNNHLKADSLYMMRMYHAYKLLDKKVQPMPFHASEITLEVLTAMLFADFDFEKTMAFLINLGRDNDTTSAVAGGILGAFLGFEKLPEAMKQKVLTVNKQQLNTDFEALANQMTDKIMSRQ